MLLKNKKTGEIGKLHCDMNVSPAKYGVFEDTDIRGHYWEYNSLAELNDEWEDYEEPKTFWYMTAWGDVKEYSQDQFAIKQKQEIGNYFDTREEAEKAVEKLKAWKRLKDGGFVFCGKGDCLDTIKFDYGLAGYNNQDFALLFGGEE